MKKCKKENIKAQNSDGQGYKRYSATSKVFTKSSDESPLVTISQVYWSMDHKNPQIGTPTSKATSAITNLIVELIMISHLISLGTTSQERKL